MWMWFKRKTLPLRHGIVKIVAPKVLNYERVLDLYVNIIPRPAIQFIKYHFKNSPLVGAEIGVAAGDNALSIISLLTVKKLYLIDCYVPYVEHDGRIRDFSNVEAVAKTKLEPFHDKIVWIKKMSEHAINDIHEPLDFVYIDGNHTYEYVKKDIQLYNGVVRDGGIISGHDIQMEPVRKAVFEYFNPNEVLILFPDWIVIKGG